MHKTLRSSSSLLSTKTAEAPLPLLEVEAQAAALKPFLDEASVDLLAPSPKALAAVLKELHTPR